MKGVSNPHSEDAVGVMGSKTDPPRTFLSGNAPQSAAIGAPGGGFTGGGSVRQLTL